MNTLELPADAWVTRSCCYVEKTGWKWGFLYTISPSYPRFTGIDSLDPSREFFGYSDDLAMVSLRLAEAASNLSFWISEEKLTSQSTSVLVRDDNSLDFPLRFFLLDQQNSSDRSSHIQIPRVTWQWRESL